MINIKNHQSILLAGAESFLGRILVRDLTARNVPVNILTKNLVGGQKNETNSSSIFEGITNQPSLLKQNLRGVTTVISTLSLVREKRSVFDICDNYQTNIYLLNEAQKAGVTKFIYVSEVKNHLHNNPQVIQERNNFMFHLKASRINYTIVNMNSVFHNLDCFLDMANKGRIYLLGKGNQKINPIHLKDLATACLDVVSIDHNEFYIGGPEVLTIKEVAEMAFKVYNKSPKIIHLPFHCNKLIIWLMQLLKSNSHLAIANFCKIQMNESMIGLKYGKLPLLAFFKNEVDTFNKTRERVVTNI